MTADHTPERLSEDAIVSIMRNVTVTQGHPLPASYPADFAPFARAITAAAAAHLADVEARLAAVEALADEWERLADGADRGSFAKRERWTGALRARATEVRAALHPDPSEVARDE